MLVAKVAQALFLAGLCLRWCHGGIDWVGVLNGSRLHLDSSCPCSFSRLVHHPLCGLYIRVPHHLCHVARHRKCGIIGKDGVEKGVKIAASRHHQLAILDGNLWARFEIGVRFFPFNPEFLFGKCVFGFVGFIVVAHTRLSARIKRSLRGRGCWIFFVVGSFWVQFSQVRHCGLVVVVVGIIVLDRSCQHEGWIVKVEECRDPRRIAAGSQQPPARNIGGTPGGVVCLCILAFALALFVVILQDAVVVQGDKILQGLVGIEKALELVDFSLASLLVLHRRRCCCCCCRCCSPRFDLNDSALGGSTSERAGRSPDLGYLVPLQDHRPFEKQEPSPKDHA
mmetsp:Transcript_15308/g.42471  ORF Transcript_15308/g.42471 Transcript_15308/m.42471 type:complete len:338 (+) Transcript_15308:2593-3606(+)